MCSFDFKTNQIKINLCQNCACLVKLNLKLCTNIGSYCLKKNNYNTFMHSNIILFIVICNQKMYAKKLKI